MILQAHARQRVGERGERPCEPTDETSGTGHIRMQGVEAVPRDLQAAEPEVDDRVAHTHPVGQVGGPRRSEDGNQGVRLIREECEEGSAVRRDVGRRIARVAQRRVELQKRQEQMRLGSGGNRVSDEVRHHRVLPDVERRAAAARTLRIRVVQYEPFAKHARVVVEHGA